jgi:hypothetical protein
MNTSPTGDLGDSSSSSVNISEEVPKMEEDMDMVEN